MPADKQDISNFQWWLLIFNYQMPCRYTTTPGPIREVIQVPFLHLPTAEPALALMTSMQSADALHHRPSCRNHAAFVDAPPRCHCLCWKRCNASFLQCVQGLSRRQGVEYVTHVSACVCRAQSCCSTTARRTCCSWTSPRASRTTSTRSKWASMRLRRCPRALSPSTTPRATSSASHTPMTREHVQPSEPVADITQHLICSAHSSRQCWCVMNSITYAAIWAALDEHFIPRSPPRPDAGWNLRVMSPCYMS